MEHHLSVSPADIARACSEVLHANDQAARSMGIHIIESTPGRAVLQMRIRPDMLNGHAVCHGGMMFALADTAFAHACNNGNKVTLASGCTIDFLAPVREGEVLTATACERSRSGRTGVYDVELTKGDGTLIATFRGRSYQIKGTVLPEESES